MAKRAEPQSHGGPFGRPTVNTVKAAELAGVSTRTIYNWIRWQWVDSVRTAGRGVRIYVDTLWRPIEGVLMPCKSGKTSGKKKY